MANSNNWGEIYKSTWWGDEDWSANSLKIDSAPPGFAFTGLLDTYTGAAAAYSVRKLSSTYTGGALRVRRSSDDTEQDIGFNASNELDTAALLSFVGTGGTDNGFVTKWYDQSGNNNDAINADASEQPLVVSGGTLVTENGKAAIDFDGVDDYFTGASKTTMNNTAIFAVIKSDSNTQDAVFIQNTLDASNFVALGLGNKGSNNAIGSLLLVGGSTVDTVGDSTFTATDQTLVSYLADNTAGQMFVDGTEETDAVGSRGGGVATTIGARGDSNNPFNGAFQEVIFFDSDQSSNRTGIETNINDHFSIYP